MTVPAHAEKPWQPRLAKVCDVPALDALIPLSARSLQIPYYSAAQIEASLGPVFGVDWQLIYDQTYFVVEHKGQIIGCGGWSKRKSSYGGRMGPPVESEQLDPEHDSARIRAFFVHPAWVRRGIARSIMAISEQAILQAHFRTVDLVATLAGEPLYASFGYTAVERYEIKIPGQPGLPVVHMTKQLVLSNP